MLCQFSFQNFKSYKGETTLDFQAATLPEFRETLITEERAADLLPVSVIYGPNGGGKSNLLQALSCVISTVVNPVHKLEKNRQDFILQQKVDAVPFLFDHTSADEPTEFYMFFRIAKNEYCYYISIKNDEVMTWFESCIIRSYANPMVEHQIMLAKDAPYKNQFIRALNDMDIDITDYRYDKDSHQLFMKRNIGSSEYELPFSDESDGTRKLIAALPVILLALREGRMVIIDELDAKLHPKLLKYVISLFKNKEINKFGAQLLFTSHDMYTLKNTVFRRDEIWFAAENDAHESEIYSLHEIRGEDNDRIKNTAAYNKQYLEGRYGADPYLSNMLGGGF